MTQELIFSQIPFEQLSETISNNPFLNKLLITIVLKLIEASWKYFKKKFKKSKTLPKIKKPLKLN